ncbi:hypothetical protein DACRYDRAFT_114365, partial [Dacryopinax primogenitus]
MSECDVPAAKRARRAESEQGEEEGTVLLTLEHLPVELLWDILILSVSPSLPLVSHRLHSVCNSAPPSIRARYILSSFLALSPTSQPTSPDPPSIPSPAPTPFRSAQSKWIYAHALLFPICTLPVFLALERIWAQVSPLEGSEPEASQDGAGAKTRNGNGTGSGAPARPVVDLDSEMWTLPRRIFRSLPSLSSPSPSNRLSPPGTSDPYPLLAHILPLYPYNTSSHLGYPLSMSVRAGHLPLIRLLLERGANPALKDSLAVRIAIAKRDLGLVRLLVEREDACSRREGWGKKRKRRRLSDRVQVDPGMLQLAVKLDARDIVQYLMERGCVPDMKTLRMVR